MHVIRVFNIPSHLMRPMRLRILSNRHGPGSRTLFRPDTLPLRTIGIANRPDGRVTIPPAACHPA